MKLVVSDASPINYLVLIGHEEILPQLFSTVVIPKVVLEEELRHPDSPSKVHAWATNPPSWVESLSPRAAPNLDLDRGETHAIALALQLESPILLDERQARKIAVSLGLKVLGIVGLLEQAAIRGLIDLPAALQQLQRTNARISPEIIIEAIARHRSRWK